nr:hypothetical protein [Tanacetum cinerariifolium]
MIEETSKGEREVAATEEVLVNPSFPDQRVIIDGGLSEACMDQLKYLYKDNMRIFAWEQSDMTSMSRRIIEHMLNVNPSMDHVCQKRRTFLMEKSRVVTNEVSEWVKAGIIRPVKYPTNLEAYVDDMVIKIKDEKMLLADIVETFDNLKRINMELNPKKCSFGVEEGKFLGYMVTSEGIRANPKKTNALADLQSSRTLKEMQSLSEKLVALNRFLANPPWEKETLYAYLAVSEEAISVVLLAGRNGRQCHVQYVSRTLNEAEMNYAPMEKLALSLIHMTRRLRRYFEAHPMKVITDQPIKNILNNTETSRKLAKYDVELRAYNIKFIPRNAVPLEIDDTESWTLFTDRASSPKGSWAGLVLIGPSGIEYTYAFRLTFLSTNNGVECEALLAELRIARQIDISNIEVKVDSKLVASQINRNYKAKVLNERSTKSQEVHTMVEEEGDNLMTPIIRCLEEGIWPKEKNEAPGLRAKIGQYAMESEVLFKKGYLVPMLRKAVRQGYYWPTMHEDVKKEVKKCDSCQIHALVPRLPKTLMMSIMAPWSFYQWGMDIQGPPPPARGGAKFVTIEIDYFTKWIKAKLLVKITGNKVIRFIMDNIICKFRLPRIIVTENGAQLVNDPNKSWRGRFEIHQLNMAVAHPQANRLVEKANRSLMEGIPTYRTLMIRKGYNKEEMRLNLDLLQERRETTVIREARYKTKMKQYYNKKVRLSGFRLGEFMFRRNKASTVEEQGKLGPNGKDHTGLWKHKKMAPTSYRL